MSISCQSVHTFRVRRTAVALHVCHYADAKVCSVAVGMGGVIRGGESAYSPIGAENGLSEASGSLPGGGGTARQGVVHRQCPLPGKSEGQVTGSLGWVHSTHLPALHPPPCGPGVGPGNTEGVGLGCHLLSVGRGGQRSHSAGHRLQSRAVRLPSYFLHCHHVAAEGPRLPSEVRHLPQLPQLPFKPATLRHRCGKPGNFLGLHTRFRTAGGACTHHRPPPPPPPRG